MNYQKDVERCLAYLAKDLNLTEADLDCVHKLLATHKQSSERPSCIAMSLVVKAKPELEELVLATENISKKTLNRIMSEL